MADPTPQTLLIVLVAFVTAHAALLVLSIRFNVLYLIAIAFLISSPLSAAPDLPIVVLLKWLRAYTTVLIVVVAVLMWHPVRLGPASWVFLLAVGFYAIAGLWSDRPFAALAYKGAMLVAVLGGVMLATSNRSSEEFSRSMRLLLIPAAVFALVMVASLIYNPAAISHIGRLAAFGMNPNRIAQTAVPLLILCAYVALHDPNKTAKMFAYGCVAALGIIIIYTGSRGSAGGALIGCFFCFLPVVRSPLRLFGSCLAILVVVLAIAWGIESAQATERLVEFSFDNRADIWGYGWQLFRDSPVIGQGWISTKSIGTVSSTDNLHSIYVNLLAETGAVGITIFILMMLFLFGRCVSVYRLVSLDRIAFLAMGGMAAVFAHGFVESGALMGSTINSFLMGFSVGLLDRVPIFFHQNAYYQGVATAGLPSVARPVPT